jgi:hypothetical protein
MHWAATSSIAAPVHRGGACVIGEALDVTSQWPMPTMPSTMPMGMPAVEGAALLDVSST